jgi:glycosyltransferase involved in cell wall biosynthesis
LNGYDAIFFNRFLFEYSHINLFDCCERDGVKVIVDLDDYYHLPEYHPNKASYKQRLPFIKENLQRADLVTVSTEYLKQKIKEDLGVDAVVLKNAVDFDEPQFKLNPTPDQRVRFGWCGGSTHERDLMLLKEDIATLHSQSTYRLMYRLVLQGYVNNDVFWRKAAMIFSNNNKAQADNLTVINAASVFNYAQGYNRFDVALAPLVDGEFERCKSELKCIEAATFGLPIIASDVEPYQRAKELLGDGVILVRNKRGAFLKVMQRLMQDKDEVKARGAIAYEAVRKHYNVQDVNELRAKHFNQCLS